MKLIKKNILFLGFLLFSLIVVAIFSWSAANNPKEIIRSEANSGVLEIPAELRKCASDEDCTLALDDCGHCCSASAVNKEQLETWKATLKKHCTGFRGLVCNCIVTKKPIAKCKTNKCEVEVTDF